jgi:hypothetical protein
MGRIILPGDDIAEEEKAERPTTALLRKNILDVLHRHYPAWSIWEDPFDPQRTTAWLIDIKDFATGGIITVQNLYMTGDMGVMIKLANIVNDPDLKKVVMYVGELLERYGLSREKAVKMRDEIYKIKRDFKGHAVYHRD